MNIYILYGNYNLRRDMLKLYYFILCINILLCIWYVFYFGISIGLVYMFFIDLNKLFY